MMLADHLYTVKPHSDPFCHHNDSVIIIPELLHDFLLRTDNVSFACTVCDVRKNLFGRLTNYSIISNKFGLDRCQEFTDTSRDFLFDV